jgi:hypothetical protein
VGESINYSFIFFDLAHCAGWLVKYLNFSPNTMFFVRLIYDMPEVPWSLVVKIGDIDIQRNEMKTKNQALH